MKCTLVFMPIWYSMTPPMSLGYLKGALLRHDIDCTTIDFSRKLKAVKPHPGGDTEAEKEILADPKILSQWKDKILATQPNVIGFSVLSSNIRVTEAMAQLIRKEAPHIYIVSGGPVFTPEQMGHTNHALNFSDYVVQGEGESVLPEIIRAIDKPEKMQTVKNIWFRNQESKNIFTGSGALPALDDYAFPNFDDADFYEYPEHDRLPMMFSRGCILNCSFCTNKWNDKTQRSRSAKNVFNELVRNVEVYKAKKYIFNDDSLLSFVTMKPIEEYCDLAIASGFTIPWAVFGTRIDRLLTPAFVNKLAKAGLHQVMFGIESFSSSVQKHMGKSSNFELADGVVRMFVDAGIIAWSYLIYGYVNETDEDFEVTYNWLKNNGGLLSKLWVHPFFVNDRYLKLRPGTVVRYGIESWAWFSEHSSIEKKKVRFLRLINLFEEIRAKHPHFSYGISDPYGQQYLTSWNKEMELQLFEAWAKMDVYRKSLRKSLFDSGKLSLGVGIPI